MLKNSSASAARVADAGACSGACGARNLMLAKESETSVLYKASWYPDKSQGSSVTTARNQLAGAPSLLANITSLLSGHEFSHPSMTSRSGQYRVSLLRNPTGERESPRCCSGPRWILLPGAEVVEGYPVDPTIEKMPDPFLWHGVTSAFREAGFREVVRRSSSRPIMRFEISA